MKLLKKALFHFDTFPYSLWLNGGLENSSCIPEWSFLLGSVVSRADYQLWLAWGLADKPVQEADFTLLFYTWKFFSERNSGRGEVTALKQ